MTTLFPLIFIYFNSFFCSEIKQKQSITSPPTQDKQSGDSNQTAGSDASRQEAFSNSHDVQHSGKTQLYINNN